MKPTEPEPQPRSDQLDDLARRVDRLGTSGRTDPEKIVLEKMELAQQLRGLARELRREEGRQGRSAPSPAAPRAAHPAGRRRLLA